jgi:hypothetical protein
MLWLVGDHTIYLSSLEVKAKSASTDKTGSKEFERLPICNGFLTADDRSIEGRSY